MLVALWGMETRYGEYQGRYQTIAALATLAHDERRHEFFRNELIEALRILDQGHVSPEAMIGSWAGAMGQVQFMPSTFTRYAVDQNQDAARISGGPRPMRLHRVQTTCMTLVGSVVKHGAAKSGCPRISTGVWRVGVTKPVRDWAALGIRQADDTPLPTAGLHARIVLPQGPRGPAFLVYRNFGRSCNGTVRSTMRWQSGILADRLIGLPPPRLESRC
jgi:membrane-bound lytic murein transglycosylase B